MLRAERLELARRARAAGRARAPRRSAPRPRRAAAPRAARPRRVRTARTRGRRAAALPRAPRPRAASRPPRRRVARPRAPRARPRRAARSAPGRARPARRAAGSRGRRATRRGSSPATGLSTLRSRETWLRSAWSAELTLCSAKSSPTSRSRETTRFALSRSRASSARCFGPPIGTGSPSTRTDERPEDPELEATRHRSQILLLRRRLFQRPGRSWDNFGTRSRERSLACCTQQSASGPARPRATLRHAAALAGKRHRGRRDVVPGRLYLPGDELALCLFESSSPAGVKRASERAGMPCERVIETVWIGPTTKGGNECAG